MSEDSATPSTPQGESVTSQSEPATAQNEPDTVQAEPATIQDEPATVRAESATPQSQEQKDALDLLLARLLKAHEAYFDVQRGFSMGGQDFDGLAVLHSHESQYVLIKRAKLWEAHTHEYRFFHCVDVLDAARTEELISLMETTATELVRPEPDHMTSYLSLIILAHHADAAACQMIKRTRWRKNLKWGLEGWIDLRLALVLVDDGSVYTNGQGKALRPTLEANLFAADGAQ